MISIEINTNDWPIRDVLSLLLMDRSAKKNIIFATDSYAYRGDGYGAKNQITEYVLSTAGRCIIQPRVLKDAEEQLLRTRKKAEVFTPAWVCCLMNNCADEEWFGRSDVFGQLKNQEWTLTESPIQMPKRKRWQAYVDSRRLEITCGEAPYLVSRYDMATGEIIPIKDRIGILDRKLRIVNENAATEEEWLKWTLRAFQAVYGYEYQGDNLLVARINLLLTYIDYLQERWDRKPTKKELEEVAKVISWNLWQMDGLKGSIPLGALYEQYHQLTIFDIFRMDNSVGEDEPEEYIPCRVFDWRGQNKSIDFNAFRERRNGSMKFDFIIGNPPYQEEQASDNADGSLKNYAPPIYDKFMDEAYKVSDRVELIHPARFLFNAGSTPKAWNEKMLKDEHFKVLHYEEDGHKVFPTLSTPLRGGVAITYRDAGKVFGAIQAFTKYPEVNDILHKVIYDSSFKTLMDIVYSRTSYRLTEVMHADHPEARYKEDKNGKNIGLLSKGHDYDMSSNIMGLIPAIFHDQKPNDGRDYIQILGRVNNRRIYKYIRRDYVKDVDNLDYYKVYVAQANGSGEFGETMSEPVVEGPGVGSTETFLSIGKFETEHEAHAVEKYIKTKFARALLSVLKVTQNGNKPVWKMIPLQDFTAASDIDWSQSVAGIDRQLYAKYGLSDEEITFIETHVKEME